MIKCFSKSKQIKGCITVINLIYGTKDGQIKEIYLKIFQKCYSLNLNWTNNNTVDT